MILSILTTAFLGGYLEQTLITKEFFHPCGSNHIEHDGEYVQSLLILRRLHVEAKPHWQFPDLSILI